MPAGSLKRIVGPSLGLLGAALSALVWFNYRRHIRRARERVSAGRLVETAGGPIEIGAAGEGPPVLVVHGAGGGFDQGLEVARPLTRSGFHVIAMSRFGYLRTPLRVDAGPAAQADAHADLLDALDVRRVAVVGASAGAPSAMQFALRHPDRTAALVLLVPATFPLHVEPRRRGAMPTKTSTGTKLLFDTALRSDFLFWAAAGIARDLMLQVILGTPPSVLRDASAEERDRIRQVLDLVQPLSQRRLGLLNDLSITRSLPRYELERIAAPTLIVGVADCLYGTYSGACYAAERIPGARFLSFPTGGHLWVGHQRDVMTEIVAFLRNAA